MKKLPWPDAPDVTPPGQPRPVQVLYRAGFSSCTGSATAGR